MVAREDGSTTTGPWRVLQPKKTQKVNDRSRQEVASRLANSGLFLDF